jgi:hypothetical protein
MQFVIPRAAANAVDFPSLRRRAREAVIADPMIEYNDRHAGPSSRRITCGESMAFVLIEELKGIAERVTGTGKLDLLIACAEHHGPRISFRRRGSVQRRTSSQIRAL